MMKLEQAEVQISYEMMIRMLASPAADTVFDDIFIVEGFAYLICGNYLAAIVPCRHLGMQA